MTSLILYTSCSSDEGETPLSNAAKAGNFETLQYLLELSNVTATNVCFPLAIANFLNYNIIIEHYCTSELCPPDGS